MALTVFGLRVDCGADGVDPQFPGALGQKAGETLRLREFCGRFPEPSRVITDGIFGVVMQKLGKLRNGKKYGGDDTDGHVANVPTVLT